MTKMLVLAMAVCCLAIMTDACPKKFLPRPTVKTAYAMTGKGGITISKKDGKLVFKFDLKSMNGDGEKGVVVLKDGVCPEVGQASKAPHYNPHKKRHGKPTDDKHHVGDMGNIEVKNSAFNGEVTAKMDLNGRESILGRSIAVFANKDDGAEDPQLGNVLACGVIGVKEED